MLLLRLCFRLFSCLVVVRHSIHEIVKLFDSARWSIPLVLQNIFGCSAMVAEQEARKSRLCLKEHSSRSQYRCPSRQWTIRPIRTEFLRSPIWFVFRLVYRITVIVYVSLQFLPCDCNEGTTQRIIWNIKGLLDSHCSCEPSFFGTI